MAQRSSLNRRDARRRHCEFDRNLWAQQTPCPSRDRVGLAPRDCAGLAFGSYRAIERNEVLGYCGDSLGSRDGRYGRRCGGDVFRGLPIAKATAKQGCSAALAAEDDDVVLHSKVRVPRHKTYVVGRGDCQYPVITGLFLDSASAGEQRGGCHFVSLLTACRTQLSFEEQLPCQSLGKLTCRSKQLGCEPGFRSFPREDSRGKSFSTVCNQLQPWWYSTTRLGGYARSGGGTKGLW